jgi:ornithine carbamoyltransferase
MQFTIASPDGYMLPEEAYEEARPFAEASGATFEVFNDPRAAVKGADVIYTDTWVSMGQEAETKKREAAFAGYQINDALLKHANKNAIAMHCLPAHRGQEITDAVADGEHSALFPQAENRLHIQKAILVHVMS